MIGYSFYMTSDNSMVYLVVENRNTDTWEAAILDWDLTEEEAKEAAREFLDGKKEPYTDDEGITWAEDKAHLHPKCEKFFGFHEIDIE